MAGRKDRALRQRTEIASWRKRKVRGREELVRTHLLLGRSAVICARKRFDKGLRRLRKKGIHFRNGQASIELLNTERRKHKETRPLTPSP